jgi:CBS domain-containing protein
MEKIEKDFVSTIMTPDVYVVQENTSLHDVVRLFRKLKVRHVPVVSGVKVIGILSRTDINRLTFGALIENQEDADEAILEMLSVTQVMTSNPKSISPDASIKSLAEVFVKEDYHALPVIENGELVGIVTTTDVIKYLLTKI